MLVLVMIAAAAGTRPRPAGASPGFTPRANGNDDQAAVEVHREVTGSVIQNGGTGVSGVVVDLFSARPDTSNRAGYLSSTTTDSAGNFHFTVPDGCYVVVVTAPSPATFTAGSRSWQQPLCAGPGRTPRTLTAELASDADVSARLEGRVTHTGGAPAPAVTVEAYGADGAGGRGPYLGSVQTDAAGRFEMEVLPGCQVLVVVAPPGDRFVDGRTQVAHPVCNEDGGVRQGLDGTLASTTALPSPLTAVEREIVRLTNGLRADPDGPLARHKPLPSCVADRFYDITVDPTTSQPETADPLTVDEAVSVRMARAWAGEMARSGQFAHRPSQAQQEIYTHLGLPVSAWGENIAWFTGYDPARTARVHFEGWRESDTGHYCTMVSPRFTHIGVGEVGDGDQSWAVQNLYR